MLQWHGRGRGHGVCAYVLHVLTSCLSIHELASACAVQSDDVSFRLQASCAFDGAFDQNPANQGQAHTDNGP